MAPFSCQLTEYRDQTVTDYLLEAKWQQKPVDAGDLYKFAGVLTGKLKNTLGLYISINGFSPECTTTKSEALKAMILMDGADLNAILDDRITLHEMLYRKRRLKKNPQPPDGNF